MQQPVRTLNAANIQALKQEFENSLACIGASIQGQSGVQLLTSIKRVKVGTGPYPDVTLFEAANRIMSDLVILNGVAGLLREATFPFTEYTVEFGNEDKNGYDIRASSPTETLIGEAFNVAPSFFQGKKATALQKLRKASTPARYRILMFNADARPARYAAKHEPFVYHVCVDIERGDIDVQAGKNCLDFLKQQRSPIEAC
ncbi:hypothetical protein ACPZMI_04265 [Pseudomonas wayambapalatensis]|uniref:hypothetical protein n=1 Tax=Pseudomonas wayambapalatensis TaxID=485895 RepID=UPI003CF4EB28